MGHEAYVPGAYGEAAEADLAIINLGDRSFDSDILVPKLREQGVRVIVHAGHKETPLLDLGKTLEADLVVTNSQLTHKLREVIEQVF